jgi:hypothetical protein
MAVVQSSARCCRATQARTVVSGSGRVSSERTLGRARSPAARSGPGRCAPRSRGRVRTVRRSLRPLILHGAKIRRFTGRLAGRQLQFDSAEWSEQAARETCQVRCLLGAGQRRIARASASMEWALWAADAQTSFQRGVATDRNGASGRRLSVGVLGRHGVSTWSSNAIIAAKHSRVLPESTSPVQLFSN